MATMDEYFKKGEVYKNQSGSTVKIDWYDKNGEVQYTHNKQSQSATEKGLKNMLERNGYKKVNDIAMEYDPIMCMMVPAKDQSFVVSYKDKKDNGMNKTVNVEANNKNEAIQKAINKFRNSNEDVVIVGASAKDQRTADFSSSDAKKIFDYIDRQVTKDMNEYPREIERAKTPADCERLDSAIRASLDNAVDEYIQIWNEVGLYAQKRKNEIVDRYGKLMSQAFKKYNELKERE